MPELQLSLDPDMPAEPLVMEEFLRAMRQELARNKARFPCPDDELVSYLESQGCVVDGSMKAGRRGW
jgi:hypothetical protein